MFNQPVCKFCHDRGCIACEGERCAIVLRRGQDLDSPQYVPVRVAFDREKLEWKGNDELPMTLSGTLGAPRLRRHGLLAPRDGAVGYAGPGSTSPMTWTVASIGSGVGKVGTVVSSASSRGVSGGQDRAQQGSAPGRLAARDQIALCDLHLFCFGIAT